MLPAPLALLLAVAAAVKPFADERVLLDRRLETLRRILPDGPSLAADQALVRELATHARLDALELRPRAPLENGAHGEVVLDVAAAGRFPEVERFFSQLAWHARLPDVESLTLTGGADGLRVTSVIRLPFRPARAPLPAPPEGLRALVNGVPRPQAEAFFQDHALALAKSETIATWRRARRNPRLFLAELTASARERPVVLTYAQWADEFVVRGLTVGDAPARALETRLERGFFRLADFVMARQGGCVRFEARGRAPVVGPDAALPLPADDPFVQDDTPCRVDRDSGRSVQARAGATNPKAPNSGPLSLRLRDVDLADVFFVLHRLTGEGFIVDGDVTGRASVDFSRVSVQEALDALQKAAGLRISSGPLRRVTLDRRPAVAPTSSVGGTPVVSFAVKHAETRDVLAVMSEADTSLAALGPPGFIGRLSVWVRDAPLADLRAAVLALAGLGERLEDGRRVLQRAGVDEAPVPVAASGASERRLVLNAHELAVVEFEAAGVGDGGAGFLAFAYSPTGTLLAYRPGDPLADGKVTDVRSTDVLLETDDGPLRVLVPALR